MRVVVLAFMESSQTLESVQLGPAGSQGGASSVCNGMVGFPAGIVC
jgi:hypothetical protein